MFIAGVEFSLMVCDCTTFFYIFIMFISLLFSNIMIFSLCLRTYCE